MVTMMSVSFAQQKDSTCRYDYTSSRQYRINIFAIPFLMSWRSVRAFVTKAIHVRRFVEYANSTYV